MDIFFERSFMPEEEPAPAPPTMVDRKMRARIDMAELDETAAQPEVTWSDFYETFRPRNPQRKGRHHMAGGQRSSR